MRTSVTSFIAAGALACASSASAFVFPSAAVDARSAARTSVASRSISLSSSSSSGRRAVMLFAEKEDGAEEQEPMDLDLEQMFEVFEAADKEVSDEEVGKKGGKKPAAGAKDPAEAMGDMLSSFFGGGEKK
ncbi:unnamed protein product [Ectocarpus fasciculatus]